MSTEASQVELQKYADVLTKRLQSLELFTKSQDELLEGKAKNLDQRLATLEQQSRDAGHQGDAGKEKELRSTAELLQQRLAVLEQLQSKSPGRQGDAGELKELHGKAELLQQRLVALEKLQSESPGDEEAQNDEVKTLQTLASELTDRMVALEEARRGEPDSECSEKVNYLLKRLGALEANRQGESEVSRKLSDFLKRLDAAETASSTARKVESTTADSGGSTEDSDTGALQQAALQMQADLLSKLDAIAAKQSRDGGLPVSFSGVQYRPHELEMPMIAQRSSDSDEEVQFLNKERDKIKSPSAATMREQQLQQLIDQAEEKAVMAEQEKQKALQQVLEIKATVADAMERQAFENRVEQESLALKEKENQAFHSAGVLLKEKQLQQEAHMEQLRTEKEQMQLAHAEQLRKDRESMQLAHQMQLKEQSDLFASQTLESLSGSASAIELLKSEKELLQQAHAKQLRKETESQLAHETQLQQHAELGAQKAEERVILANLDCQNQIGDLQSQIRSLRNALSAYTGPQEEAVAGTSPRNSLPRNLASRGIGSPRSQCSTPMSPNFMVPGTLSFDPSLTTLAAVPVTTLTPTGSAVLGGSVKRTTPLPDNRVRRTSPQAAGKVSGARPSPYTRQFEAKLKPRVAPPQPRGLAARVPTTAPPTTPSPTLQSRGLPGPARRAEGAVSGARTGMAARVPTTAHMTAPQNESLARGPGRFLP